MKTIEQAREVSARLHDQGDNISRRAAAETIDALIKENERIRLNNIMSAAEDAKEIEGLEAEIEQLRVQLAGCGVAAMQNTEDSKAQRAKKGDYGWSESYGDVCRAVDLEIELRVYLAVGAKEKTTLDKYPSLC